MSRIVSSETRAKLSAARTKAWAAIPQERRREMNQKAIAAYRRAEQLNRIKNGKLLTARAVNSTTLDPDFDEGF